jgi:acetyl esterase/lipase
MLSPWADLEMTGESALTMARKDPMLLVGGLKKWAGMYLGGTDPKDPLVSPIYADLKSLPPMLIQVGSREILLDDAIRLAERARQYGVDVEIDVLDGMFHISQVFCPLVPESKAAVKRIGSYCADKMTGPPM